MIELLHNAWLSITLIALLVWASRHLQLFRAARLMPPLRATDHPSDVAALPSISFLVAGKDEEENIETCLNSMITQDYPALQVICANDRSSDRTGPIMDRIAASTDRLNVVHVTELPTGWLGKNNAMRQAVERATGQWLCFTDADCTLVSPRTVRIAMNYALKNGIDFLSILPAHDTQSFWETVVQPACSGIMMIWFNPFRVNNPRRKAAYANGAFMLMSRDCYDAIGRHDAVKAEFNEDMHMARLAKSIGRKLRVISNDGLYTVRMYGSLKATWNGWSRIFYGCFGTLRRLLLAIVVVVLLSLLPWLTLLVSASLSLASGSVLSLSPWRWLLLTSAAACLAQASVMWRFYKLNRTPAYYGLLYPIGAAVGLGALVNAIRRLRNRATINWRGTVYNASINSPQAAR